MLPSSRVYASWLALFRIFTGLFFLAHGITKFTNSAQYMPPKGVMPMIIAHSISSTTGPYHDFLAGIVLPHIGLFAELVRFGEVLVGVSLLFGFYTRLGGLVGMFLMVNYMASSGAALSIDGWSGLEGAVFALCALNVALPTGRMLGIDWLLHLVMRKPEPAALKPEFVDEPPIATAPPPVQGGPQV